MRTYLYLLVFVLLAGVTMNVEALSLNSTTATKLPGGSVGQALSIDVPFDPARVASMGIGCDSTKPITSYVKGTLPRGIKLEPVTVETAVLPTSQCSLSGLTLTGIPAAARTYAFSITYNTNPLYKVNYSIKINKRITNAMSNAVNTNTNSSTTPVASTDPSVSLGPKVYTNDELLALADNAFADGILPLGDKKYVTDAAKRGYVYFCNVPGGNNAPGAGTAGPWIDGTTWNYLEKISVAGDVAWPSATFKNAVAGTTRTMTGNGLPINHNTGTFPIGSNDPAYQYDRNPNSIKSQTLSKQLPVNPTYLSTPQCMGMESGFMLSGVPLFGPFDAQLRDAMAHEVQDKWNGHPQVSGQYHYHGPTAGFNDDSITTVVGYALDGFPITGGRVAADKYLTTSDLDECHGLTSKIIVDGVEKTTYHYVMTRDFPYSVSCFRGKPISTQIGNGMQSGTGQRPGITPAAGQQTSAGLNGPKGKVPPQAAVSACSNKVSAASCSFTGSAGVVSGMCGTPPGMTRLACMPARPQ